MEIKPLIFVCGQTSPIESSKRFRKPRNTLTTVLVHLPNPGRNIEQRHEDPMSGRLSVAEGFAL